MKIIRSYYERICKVLCSICNEREYVDIDRFKEYPNEDDEVYVFSFNNLIKFGFFKRLKDVFLTLKNFNSYKNGEHQFQNSMTLDFEQISELYNELYNDALNNDILKSKDIEYINKNKKLKISKYNNKDNFFIGLLFKSKENMVLSASIIKRDKMMSYCYYHLGWTLPYSLTKKELKRSAIKYIFNRTSYYFKKCELFIYKNDLIEFLFALNYIVTNTKVDKNGYHIYDSKI